MGLCTLSRAQIPLSPWSKRRANLWRPPLEGGLEAEGACVEESVARPLPIDPVVLLESRPDFYIKKTRAAAVPHKLRRE